jgi:hypothetical protein
MSRRHHGRPHHARHRPDAPRPELAARQTPPTTIDATATDHPTIEATAPVAEPMPGPDGAAPSSPDQSVVTATPAVAAMPPSLRSNGNGHVHLAEPAPSNGVPLDGAPVNGTQVNGAPPPGPQGNGVPVNGRDDRPNGCTAPQLRRFIKSRPYVPMHELRRRFAIDGGEDDVTQVRLEEGHVYVGLPIVVGVYPMRPVPRT